tara:strand:- start:142 stop:474 length:333 start_codon:yes stop_codon:yes gene_type:complete
MSDLKLKFDDTVWTPSTSDPNWRDNLNNSLNSEWNYVNTTLKMSIHPGWLEQMDDLDIGDAVTTHEGEIGIISKILPVTGLQIKRFEVIVENKAKTFFSMNLKKIGKDND